MRPEFGCQWFSMHYSSEARLYVRGLLTNAPIWLACGCSESAAPGRLPKQISSCLSGSCFKGAASLPNLFMDTLADHVAESLADGLDDGLAVGWPTELPRPLHPAWRKMPRQTPRWNAMEGQFQQRQELMRRDIERLKERLENLKQQVPLQKGQCHQNAATCQEFAEVQSPRMRRCESASTFPYIAAEGPHMVLIAE